MDGSDAKAKLRSMISPERLEEIDRKNDEVIAHVLERHKRLLEKRPDYTYMITNTSLMDQMWELRESLHPAPKLLYLCEDEDDLPSQLQGLSNHIVQTFHLRQGDVVANMKELISIMKDQLVVIDSKQPFADEMYQAVLYGSPFMIMQINEQGTVPWLVKSVTKDVTERQWEVLSAFKGGVTAKQFMEKAGLSQRPAYQYIERFTKKGFIYKSYGKFRLLPTTERLLELHDAFSNDVPHDP
jgi:predicted transcriptional regulator